MGHGGKVMCEKDVVLGDIGFKKKAHWKKKLGGRGQNDKCILRRFVKKDLLAVLTTTSFPNKTNPKGRVNISCL